MEYRYILSGFSSTDADTMEVYFHEMSLKGWHLDRCGTFWNRFVKGEKQDIRYYIELLDQAELRSLKEKYKKWQKEVDIKQAQGCHYLGRTISYQIYSLPKEHSGYEEEKKEKKKHLSYWLTLFLLIALIVLLFIYTNVLRENKSDIPDLLFNPWEVYYVLFVIVQMLLYLTYRCCRLKSIRLQVDHPKKLHTSSISLVRSRIMMQVLFLVMDVVLFGVVYYLGTLGRQGELNDLMSLVFSIVVILSLNVLYAYIRLPEKRKSHLIISCLCIALVLILCWGVYHVKSSQYIDKPISGTLQLSQFGKQAKDQEGYVAYSYNLPYYYEYTQQEYKVDERDGYALTDDEASEYLKTHNPYDVRTQLYVCDSEQTAKEVYAKLKTCDKPLDKGIKGKANYDEYIILKNRSVIFRKGKRVVEFQADERIDNDDFISACLYNLDDIWKHN